MLAELFWSLGEATGRRSTLNATFVADKRSSDSFQRIWLWLQAIVSRLAFRIFKRELETIASKCRYLDVWFIWLDATFWDIWKLNFDWSRDLIMDSNPHSQQPLLKTASRLSVLTKPLSVLRDGWLQEFRCRSGLQPPKCFSKCSCGCRQCHGKDLELSFEDLYHEENYHLWMFHHNHLSDGHHHPG